MSISAFHSPETWADPSLRYCSIAMILLALFLPLGWASVACAQIPDPFNAQSGEWIPLEAFETKGDAPVAPKPEAAPAAAEANAASQPASQPAAPDRPLNYPVMPAAQAAPDKQGTEVVVTSTADEKVSLIEEKKDWSDVATADEEAAKQEAARKLLQDRNKDPFGVRFSVLPNAKVQVIPAARVTRPKLEREEQAEKAAQLARGNPVKDMTPEQKQVAKTEETKKAAKAKEQNEACEAFTDFRRRQLEALESDRRTLAELRTALSELGLVNKLSFMAGPDGREATVDGSKSLPVQTAKTTQ